MAQLSGYDLPADITTTGNKMFVKFYSDLFLSMSGYYAMLHGTDLTTIEADDNCTASNSCGVGEGHCTSHEHCGANLYCGNNDDCAVELGLPNGTNCCIDSQTYCYRWWHQRNGNWLLESPNYPNEHVSELSCIWYIEETSTRYLINIEAAAFEVEVSLNENSILLITVWKF